MKSALFILFISTSITTLFSMQDPVRTKWMEWATAQVDAEKNSFLAAYGLHQLHLHNPEVIEGIRNTHDQLVEKEVTSYKTKLVHGITSLWLSLTKNKALHDIQQMAHAIFVGPHCTNIEVINNPRVGNNVGVYQHYASGMCSIILSAHEHTQDLRKLEELLRHEYSHIVYEDNFHKEMIQCTAWLHSSESKEEIEEKSAAFCRAYETRADIYAALTSPYHGQHLINWLKMSVWDESIITHPSNRERIGLLEHIKDEIDAQDHPKVLTPE